MEDFKRIEEMMRGVSNASREFVERMADLEAPFELALAGICTTVETLCECAGQDVVSTFERMYAGALHVACLDLEKVKDEVIKENEEMLSRLTSIEE